MILKRLTVGEFSANCYIVGSEKEKTGMIVDAGGDAGRIISEVRNLGLKINYIL
jgi:glyoxylase-like metal-dependent hydrolase (beta-lactamase superfamily II)